MTAPENVSLEGLRRVSLLQGLGDDVLADVAHASRFRRYRSRQEVIARDDVDRDCFLVLAGRLRVIAWSPGGREVSFRDVDAGETFGEMAAIDGRPRSASVVALTETLVARLSPETLLELLHRHWPICERMLQHLAGSARALTERVYELSTLNVQQRLCAELLRLALAVPDAGDPLLLRPAPNHADLGARIGCAREQVTRALSELEQQGLVKRGEGALAIVDLQRLAERVESSRSGA